MQNHRVGASIPHAPKNSVHIPGQAGHNFKKVSALVVERTELMREALVGVLRSLGLGKVCATDNPAYAFELFTSNPFDFVFTDWSPGLDGITFLRTLRLDPDTPSPFVPVVMVSANTEPRHIFHARDNGVHEYVAKPFTANRLYSHMASIVDRHRQFIKSQSFFGPDRRGMCRAHGSIAQLPLVPASESRIPLPRDLMRRRHPRSRKLP